MRGPSSLNIEASNRGGISIATRDPFPASTKPPWTPCTSLRASSVARMMSLIGLSSRKRRRVSSEPENFPDARHRNLGPGADAHRVAVLVEVDEAPAPPEFAVELLEAVEPETLADHLRELSRVGGGRGELVGIEPLGAQ